MKKGTKYKILAAVNIIIAIIFYIIGSNARYLSSWYEYKELMTSPAFWQFLILFSIILWGIGEIVDNTTKKEKEK